MPHPRTFRVLLAVASSALALASQAAGPEPQRPPLPQQQPAAANLPLQPAVMKQMQADLQPILAATHALNQCTAIANHLEQFRPPPGHREARMAEHRNQAIARRDPAFANLPMIRHEPAHEGFMRAMQKGKVDLENCARQLAPAMKSMPAHIKRLHEQIDNAGKPGAMPIEVAKQLFGALNHYDNAHERYAEAVTKLSKDQDVQAYLHDAIHKLIEATFVPGEPVKK